mgnify:FL=1|jgi:hypothetical protein
MNDLELIQHSSIMIKSKNSLLEKKIDEYLNKLGALQVRKAYICSINAPEAYSFEYMRVTSDPTSDSLRFHKRVASLDAANMTLAVPERHTYTKKEELIDDIRAEKSKMSHLRYDLQKMMHLEYIIDIKFLNVLGRSSKL